ncbi:protein phosphatase 1 regulatory subunit 15A-like [Xyrauchen texanus]|uniref:protein phosphatase 1 regulatory subunit 15A-like n=1 Tax=Xyrauchen texanus TaxID=154827 RepID=UPI0022428560|nr:protein phosphatase 1 regulatory subunit 15A-like [Xyrauchen texanus]
MSSDRLTKTRKSMIMAPFILCPPHPLSHQCHLPQAALYKQSKMSPELSSSTQRTYEDLHLNPYCRMSIYSMLLNIRLHLWQVILKVVKCCMCVKELFSFKMFFFTCVGKNMAMTGDLKMSGVEAQERPVWELRIESMSLVNIEKEINDPEMKAIMGLDDEELIWPIEKQELSVNDSVKEEDDEGPSLSEWLEWESEDEIEESDDNVDEENEKHPPQDEYFESERNEDVDSEWSDDDDDDDDDEGDSEASAESLELWESFLNSSDPYNPLSFSSATGSRTNFTSTTENQLILRSQIKQVKHTTSKAAEEHYPKPSTKEGVKKVCFSDEVTVHPLVAWRFASRAARDGSCWLQMARDRERFKRRVENIEKVIKLCLSPEHRACVWKRLQRETLS